MRLLSRGIDRGLVMDSIDTYELIEEYPGDKYLPSYLVLARREDDRVHILFAADVACDNVRVVTVYRPDPDEWDEQLKRRRSR